MRFLRELGLSLELIGDLVRDGAVADTAHLEAALSGQAERVRAEVCRQTDILSRLEETLASLRREGAVAAVAMGAGYSVSIKEIPDQEVVGVRRSVRIWEIGELFGEAGRKLRSRPAGPPREIYIAGPESKKKPEEYVTEIQFPVK